MSAGAVVLCRMDSTRLPGKVLKAAWGRPLLDYVLARARRVPGLDGPVVVATSDRPVDDPIAEHGRRRGVAVFRGSVDDVAGRALACARRHGMQRFCRMNGDSPFIEPALVGQGLRRAEEEGCDLVTNLCPRSFPYGVSVEVIATDAMERAYRAMDRPDHFEHVTRYFYEHPERFRLANMPCPEGDHSAWRMTVDTADDFHRFEQVASRFGPVWEQTSYRDVLAFLGASL